MMQAGILLENLQSNGVKLSVEHGKLKVESPERKLLPEIKEALKTHKAEIINLLTSFTREPDPLRDFCAVCKSLLIEQPNGEWDCSTPNCFERRIGRIKGV